MTLRHDIIAADAWAVPKPFRTFAVRSEEPRHGTSARAPYAQVHVIRTNFLEAADLERLAARGRSCMRVSKSFDIDYSSVTLEALAALVPSATDLVGGIAAALLATRVLGDDLGVYRGSVAARIDYLAARGAGFHNDVDRHWTGCLFWNLALCAADAEFVMPHAGVRHAVRPGELIVFDPSMAHGLCRPRDQGQAVAASFDSGAHCEQIFLSGELALTDAQWATLGSPWLAVEEHAQRGALDLMAAEFDERSGAIKRVRALAHCMRRGSPYVV